MRRYSSFILIFLLLSSLPGCTRTRSVRVAPTARSASEAGETGSPTALSNFIQATLKISQENTVAAEEALKALYKRRPVLGELANQISKNGTDIDSRRLLADAYVDEGLLPFAFQMYQEIQSIKKDDPRAVIGIARIWDKWGDYNLAYQHAERAVLLAPTSAEALETLGMVHLHKNQIDQALSAFLTAVEIKPENASLLSNTGYAFMKRGDLRQARTYLERAVAADESLVQARNNLGIVLARLDEPNAALAEFMAVNEPAAAFNNLGVVYLDQKKWTIAREAFRRALALDPTHKKARQNLVETEARMPRPTIINLPPFQNDVAATPSKPDSSMPVAAPREKRNTVTGRDSRISSAYKDALNRFRGRRYTETIEILQWLLQQYPNDELASNYEYWIGESYFGLGDFTNAYSAFKRVTAYSRSAKRNDAVLMMRRAAIKQRLAGRSKG